MSVALRTITRLQDADDINVSLGAGVDEYALTWDNDTSKFVLRQVAGVYLLATGATTGATAQAQAFTNGVVTGLIKPSTNSTTAVLVRNAEATVTVVDIDTTNKRVGVGAGVPACNVHVAAPGAVYGLWESTEGGGDWIGFFSSGTFGPALYWKSSNALRFIRTDSNLGTTTTSEAARFTATGLVGIGTTAPGSLLHANLVSAATNAVTNVLTVGHDTSGTAAAGFGAGQLFALESSTTAAQSAARIQVLWYEATHATRKADLVLTAYDTAEREGLRIRGAGSAPAIGFLGATPQARIAHVADPAGGATVDAEARSAINSILATLENFGFHATA